jgi:hypothetical protein
MKTVFLVSLLILILALPFSTKAQVPVRPEIPQAVTMEEVRQFMNEYKDRYMKMDLDSFMDLFSKEAVENRILPYADLREGYEETFANSDAIEYSMDIESIQTYATSAFVSGRYKLIQSLKGGYKGVVFQGNIQWNIIREDGSLKIKEINYGRDR